MAEEQTPVDANELTRLRALVADYETKMTDAAALVARVRHEINNPLAGLLGQAQLLLREELSGKTRERAETIEKLAIRIKEIVGELRQVQTPVAALCRRTPHGYARSNSRTSASSWAIIGRFSSALTAAPSPCLSSTWLSAIVPRAICSQA